MQEPRLEVRVVNRLYSFNRRRRGETLAEERPLILVVEDNVLIAMEVEFMAEECGCAVAGPAGDVNEALQVAGGAALAGAVLDINLGEERVWPVAEYLEERSVPFVLATGCGDGEVPVQFRGKPILSKPLSQHSLAEALRQIGVLS